MNVRTAPDPVFHPTASTAPPCGGLPLTLPCGTVLWLLAQRAVWWPEARMAFVADVHFGKAATFRRAGQPVPHGTTADNLARLDAVLAATQARHLVFLGDFVHARSGADTPLWQQLMPWRERHAQLRMTLVRGNHDLHAGDPPCALGLSTVSEPWQPVQDVALLAAHHPHAVAGHTVLAGHWHPTVRLHGPARDTARLHCFAWSQGQLVLPAFGAFTGTSTQPLPPGSQRFAIAVDRVLALPPGVAESWRLPA